MGIFADFLNSRPMTIETERIARREMEALRDKGDADAPGGFTGRTGWAILKVLTLTDLTEPPAQGDLLGFAPQDIDYQRALISPDTAAIIANQVAIDDGNRGLEQDILIHLDLCKSKPGKHCRNTPGPFSAIILSCPIDDYNAASLGLNNGDDVDIWNSDTGTDFMTKGNTGTVFSPTFEAAAFNGLGGVLVNQNAESGSDNIVFMDSDKSIQAFAGKTGTFAVVIEPRFPWIFGNMLVGHGGDVGSPEEERFTVLTAGGPFFATFVGSGGAQLETPTVGIADSVPQLFLWWRDGDRIEFRRNGVAKTGRSVAPSNEPQPAHTLRWFGRLVKSDAFTGAIARILRWDRVLLGQEQKDIEAELTDLYF